MARSQSQPLTWPKLLNGIGGALIAYFVVFLVATFAPLSGLAGRIEFVVLIFFGVLLAWGIYRLFERV